MATYTTSNVGYLYNHETGNDDDGSPMDNVFIESSDFELGNGDNFNQLVELFLILNLQETEVQIRQ